MPRQRSPDSIKAEELYRSGLTLVEIASQLNVSPGTVRSWKNRYKWDGNESATLQSNKCNAAKKKRRAVAEEVKEVVDNKELTDKQQLFCIMYVKCFNATKAYQKAYGADYYTAKAHGFEQLRKVAVKKEIERLKQNRLNRELLGVDDVFQKYMDIAFADITDYTEFGTDTIEDPDTGEEIPYTYVRLKDSNAVDGTIISEVSKGKDGAKVKLNDRMKALQWLSEHMGFATEKQRKELELLSLRVEKEKRSEQGTQESEVADLLRGLLDEINE